MNDCDCCGTHCAAFRYARVRPCRSTARRCWLSAAVSSPHAASRLPCWQLSADTVASWRAASTAAATWDVDSTCCLLRSISQVCRRVTGWWGSREAGRCTLTRIQQSPMLRYLLLCCGPFRPGVPLRRHNNRRWRKLNAILKGYAYQGRAEQGLRPEAVWLPVTANLQQVSKGARPQRDGCSKGRCGRFVRVCFAAGSRGKRRAREAGRQIHSRSGARDGPMGGGDILWDGPIGSGSWGAPVSWEARATLAGRQTPSGWCNRRQGQDRLGFHVYRMCLQRAHVCGPAPHGGKVGAPTTCGYPPGARPLSSTRSSRWPVMRVLKDDSGG